MPNIIIPDKFAQQQAQQGQPIPVQMAIPTSVQKKMSEHIALGKSLYDTLDNMQKELEDNKEKDYEYIVISTLKWLVECNLPVEP